MSAIHIYDVRFSFIFTETGLQFLEKDNKIKAPCSFISDKDEFSALFDTLQQKESCTLDGTAITLRAPWHRTSSKDRFWKFYCESGDPKQLSGSKAWSQLIPIHRSFSTHVTLPDDPALTAAIGKDVRPNLIIRLDGFLSQVGIAVIVTCKYAVAPVPGALATATPSLSPDQLIALGHYLRYKELVIDAGELSKVEAGTTENITMNDMAARALAQMRIDILAPDAPVGHQPDEPFSVVTIVHADGCRPEDAPKPKDEIHELLEALSEWNPGYKLTLPATITERTIEYKGTPIPGDILYTGKRGRVIWFPSKFTKTENVQHTLSCYHRNITFLSMEVERLSLFCRQIANALEDGTLWMNLSVQQRNQAKHAGDVLGMMYGDSERTYRSLSPRNHIERNKYKKGIDAVRKAAGRPAMHE